MHHPVGYHSRKLTLAEMACPAHFLEFLAVLRAKRAFRHYLSGSGPPRPPGARSDFALLTNSPEWTRLRTLKKASRFLARWPVGIQRFCFDVKHVQGRLRPTDFLPCRGHPALVRQGHRSAAIDAPAPADRVARAQLLTVEYTRGVEAGNARRPMRPAHLHGRCHRRGWHGRSDSGTGRQ